MESCGRRVAAILFFGAFIVISNAANDVVPMPKLRPENPSNFFPSVVRLDAAEVTEVAALYRSLGQEHLALQVEKSQALRAVPPEAAILAGLLSVSSDRVKEWALRGLGEHRGDKQLATPAVLKIACDPNADEMSRALAVRVLGTTPMDSETVAKLAAQLGTTGKELSALVLEIIASAGDAGRPIAPALRKHLTANEAIVQYYAFDALQKLEPTSVDSNTHYRTAEELAAKQDTNRANLRARSLAALNDPASPKYLRCVALQNLIGAGNDLKAVEAIVRSVADPDPFISELAANILAKVNATSSVDGFARGLLHNDRRVRLHSALALRRMGTNAISALPVLSNLMRDAAAGRADVPEVGVSLDVLRALGSNAAPASASVAALLPENCPIYRNVEKHEVHRFRGFIFVTLAEIGVPKEAMPFIADALANSDEQMSYGFAGAARAAGSLATNAAPLLPHLLRPLEENAPQDFLDFTEFDAHFSVTGEYTTCQVESLRALRRIGAPARSALPTVRAFLSRAVDWVASPDRAKRMPMPTVEASQTIAALESDGTRTAHLQP